MTDCWFFFSLNNNMMSLPDSTVIIYNTTKSCTKTQPVFNPTSSLWFFTFLPNFPWFFSLPVEQGLERAIKWQKEEGGSWERGAGWGCTSVCVGNKWNSVGVKGAATKVKPLVTVKTTGKGPRVSLLSLKWKEEKKAKDRKTSPQVLKVTSQSREDDKRAPASLNCHHTLKTEVNEYDN